MKREEETMTLDEAIKHAEEVANVNEGLCETVHTAMQLSDYGKCAEEHRQLAEWLKDYKRLLEQEPCEDAVSRAEVLKGYIEVGRADGVEIYSDKAVPVEYINNLPPVTPTRNEWITVSERLPKQGETEGNVTKYYLVQGEYGDRFVACYNGKWQQIFHYDCEIEEEVVAWMPLPEPYKEGEKDV